MTPFQIVANMFEGCQTNENPYSNEWKPYKRDYVWQKSPIKETIWQKRPVFFVANMFEGCQTNEHQYRVAKTHRIP